MAALTPYQKAMQAQKEAFGYTTQELGNLKGQNAALLQQLQQLQGQGVPQQQLQQQTQTLPAISAQTFQPITDIKPTSASVQAFQNVYDAYINQLAGEKQKALAGVQNIYAGRGITGSGEEATALGETAGQYGYAQANLASQLAQQAAQQGLSLAQYNQQLGLNLGQLLGNIGGLPTLAAQGQQADIANQLFQQQLQSGQLTGMFQGAPTLAAQEYQNQLKQQQLQNYLNLAQLTGQTPVSMFQGTPFEQAAQQQLPTLTSAEQIALNIYNKSGAGMAASEMGQATLDSALAKQKQIQGGMITTPQQQLQKTQQQVSQQELQNLLKTGQFGEQQLTGMMTEQEKFNKLNWITGDKIGNKSPQALENLKTQIVSTGLDTILNANSNNVVFADNMFEVLNKYPNTFATMQPGKVFVMNDKNGVIKEYYYIDTNKQLKKVSLK